MTKNKPVYEERLGSIRLAVWANATERGTFFNVTIVRRYKDADGEFRESHTFTDLADLALVAEATRLAREFIRTSRSHQGMGEGDATDF